MEATQTIAIHHCTSTQIINHILLIWGKREERDRLPNLYFSAQVSQTSLYRNSDLKIFVITIIFPVIAPRFLLSKQG